MRILLIEDDDKLAEVLERGLEENGMRVTRLADVRTGRRRIGDSEHDVVVLDVMLPDGNGFDLCAEARRCGVKTPILMLTARGAVEDRVRGLDAGADDYLAKPFAFPELLARLRALSRRPPAMVDEVLSFRDLQVNLRTRAVRKGQTPLQFTSMEWRLLEFFVRNAGSVVDRAAITAYVWDENHDPASNMLEVLVSRVRRKIDAESQSSFIETLRGSGYRFGP